MKYRTISNTLLIILLIDLIIFPRITAVEHYDTYFEKELSETIDKFDDYDIYRFCYIESGYVDHEQQSYYQRRIFWPAPPGFGFGLVILDLIGLNGDLRLKVNNIFGTTIYDYDVHVIVIGFIGYAWPTVSIYQGILKGCANIVIIAPIT
jgi:hypothetical protein